MMASLLQAWVFISGALSIWLLSDPRSRFHRLGCWVGLASQPIWLWSTSQNHQWGMFALSLIYIASFLRGILQHRPSLPVKVHP
ncbi:hypothetical protein [Herminiimonas sp. CN]|uniref:hypothetical protein n=1 Tax=Herminiimonas sp. CN TaxID=1349818 RepID=UPI0004731DD3|nr:hypothetical protein [Herminiimonas sp. CN]